VDTARAALSLVRRAATAFPFPSALDTAAPLFAASVNSQYTSSIAAATLLVVPRCIGEIGGEMVASDRTGAFEELAAWEVFFSLSSLLLGLPLLDAAFPFLPALLAPGAGADPFFKLAGRPCFTPSFELVALLGGDWMPGRLFASESAPGAGFDAVPCNLPSLFEAPLSGIGAFALAS
jgi:hypothetical protein